MYGTQINHLLLAGPQSPLLATLWFSRPSPAEQEAKGQIIIMVEIPGHSSKLQLAINKFIKDLEAAYYNAATNEIESGLEQALRLANAQLPSLANSEDKRWTEKTTMLIAVHHNDDLYFSHIGKAWGMFITPTKAVMITDTDKHWLVNPLKPFNFISSGQLPPESAICFANSALLDYIASEKLRKLCLQLPPLGVINNLEELLTDVSPKLNIMTVIMRHMAISTLPPLKTATPLRPAHNYYEPAAKDLPVSEQSIKNLASRRAHTAKLLSVPSLKQNLLAKTRTLAAWLSRTAKLLTDKSAWQRWRQTNQKNITLARLTLARLLKRLTRLATSPWWRPTAWLTGLARQLSRIIVKIKKINRVSQIILGLLVLAVIILSQGILWQAQIAGQPSAALPANFMVTAQNLLTEATNALIYGDEQKSIAALTDLHNQLQSLTKPQQQNPVLQPVWNDFNELQNRLGRIIVLNNFTAVASLSGQNPRSLLKINNDLWTVTANGLTKINITDGSRSQVASQTADLTAADNNYIYLLANEQLTLADQTGSLTSLNWTRLPTHQRSSAIIVYNQRLYVLDSDRGQIFRYRRRGTDLADGAPWLRQTLAPHTGLAMAVDGAVYVLTEQNIQKFSQGSAANFSLKGLWPTLKQPTILTVGNQYLYVVEPAQQRLIVVNKQTGQLDRQYRSPLLQQARALTVELNEQSAYVLIGEDIKKIDLAAR